MSISLNSVSYAYARSISRERYAVRELTLELGESEFVGLTGAPGCGKSTVIKLAAGLIKPEKGSVTLDGRNINARRYNRAELRASTGVVLQHPERQLFETTAEREAAYALRGRGLSSEETDAAVKEAMESVGLDYDRMRNVPPMCLSSGERLRLALAAALAGKPRILLLDEPFAGLDAAGRGTLLELLDGMNKAGVTILLATGDGDALAEHAGRILALRDGAVVREGRALKVYSDYNALAENGIPLPQAREAAALLGLPKRAVSYKQLLTGLKIVCGGGK